MKMEAAFLTHIGGGTRNEDAIFCKDLFYGEAQAVPAQIVLETDEIWFVAVADGMGGYGNGDFASRFVLEFLAHAQTMSAQDWSRQTVLAHRGLLAQAVSAPSVASCGTTIAALSCGVDGLLAINIGDSRIYKTQGDYLALLSTDDCRFRRTADAGSTSDKPGNGLLQAIGGPPGRAEPVAHIRSLSSALGRFLLCTDGVTDTLTIEEIEASVCFGIPLFTGALNLQARLTDKECRDNYSFIILDLNHSESQ